MCDFVQNELFPLNIRIDNYWIIKWIIVIGDKIEKKNDLKLK